MFPGRADRELVVLPRDSLNGTAPCLSYLESKDLHLHWDSQQLVEILNRIPSLETLELINVLPSSNLKSSLPEVILTRLRSILLSGEPAGCTYALDLVSFPSTARIQFMSIMERGLTALENIVIMLPPISKFRRRLSEPETIFFVALITYHLRNAQHKPFDKAEAVVKTLEGLTPLTEVGMLEVDAEEGFWNSQVLEVLAAKFDGLHTFHVQGDWGADSWRTTSDLLKTLNGARVSAFPLTELKLTDLDSIARYLK
ncbi:hypothetical protein K435DRAFT_880518 [Dendrothele bispora CBS 962.96]|uniref:Uncharacterized protein n=1 Tax=Dendrothele bispora (strain CBS 962.96) TaxID=1314807 RepID=A0A4S8KKD4_DENBC|nr:hypothetical protein K435DRAFT_880518 [Dendrothele bispora CBS 962.96]